MKTTSANTELHELFEGRLKIYQKENGYRFSVDSILLADFAVARSYGKVADLGTGSGILPVILSRHNKFSKITGIEIQSELAELAEQNIVFNQCQDKTTIIHSDIKEIRSLFNAGQFDAVITNPPFYPAASGKISPCNENAVARHELCGTLHDFIVCADFLLKNGGKFISVFLSSRIADLITLMRQKNIEPKTLQFVHSRIDEPASMVLTEGVKNAGAEIKILPPMILYDFGKNYTIQAKSVFARI